MCALAAHGHAANSRVGQRNAVLGRLAAPTRGEMRIIVKSSRGKANDDLLKQSRPSQIYRTLRAVVAYPSDGVG